MSKIDKQVIENTDRCVTNAFNLLLLFYQKIGYETFLMGK